MSGRLGQFLAAWIALYGKCAFFAVVFIVPPITLYRLRNHPEMFLSGGFLDDAIVLAFQLMAAAIPVSIVWRLLGRDEAPWDYPEPDGDDEG